MRLGSFIGRRASLYEHIRAHLTDSGLSDEGQTLPDEDEIAGDSDLRWAPGALEGAFSRHATAEDDEALVADLHSALIELADRAGGRSRARARGAFRRAEPRTHVGGVLARLEAFPPRNLDRLYAEVRAIAVESGRREEVKFALAVLDGFGREEDARSPAHVRPARGVHALRRDRARQHRRRPRRRVARTRPPRRRLGPDRAR